jgi:hypothetical protein
MVVGRKPGRARLYAVANVTNTCFKRRSAGLCPAAFRFGVMDAGRKPGRARLYAGGERHEHVLQAT